MGLPWWLRGKEATCNAEDVSLIPRLEGPLEKEMAICSSVLVWEIPWTEETGRLQSIEMQESDNS